MLLIVRFFGRTVLYFIPAAAIPIAGFVAAQYAVFGELKLPYESFGTDEYLWEGSLWKSPLELDAFNPQIAARLLSAFRSWRALEPERRKAAKKALQRVAKAKPLSHDVFEIVSKMLE